jgi:hypothetical protein
MNYYISIYHAIREEGGGEEGGWSYWDRSKFHDIKVSFDTETKVQRALKRLHPVLQRHPDFADDIPYLSRLEAYVFKGEHGPEEHSESSTYS